MQAFNQAMIQQQQYLQNCSAEFYAGMQNAMMDAANAASNDDDMDDKPEM